jgi:hypothetical protein
MKSIARDGNRMQRLVFATLQRERGRDIAPAGKVSAWGVITAFVCLLGVATMFLLVYVAAP